MNRPLPARLHAAYDWTAAAGEIDELRDLTGHDLAAYCAASAANARDNDYSDVLEDDLDALHDWLRGES